MPTLLDASQQWPIKGSLMTQETGGCSRQIGELLYFSTGLFDSCCDFDDIVSSLVSRSISAGFDVFYDPGRCLPTF